jgi:hypothetical protein
MRSRPLRTLLSIGELWLPIAAIVACVSGCGIELGGLEVPDAASVSGTTSAADTGAPVATPVSSPDGSSPVSDALDAAMPPLDTGAPVPDAAFAADASEGAPPSVDCDRDKDGFQSTSPGCGGKDCCDNDARTHPGEQAFFTSENACGSFDYDCDGVVEPQFAKVNCTLAVLACNGSGFDQAPPSCGVVATFDDCNLGLGCYTTQSQQAQSCH